jgi:hypothetical protein
MSRARFLIAGKMPAVLAPALGLLCGCLGYRLGPVTPSGYKTVAVPMFRNATLRPQLEAQVTNAVLKRLQTDGSLRVASAADAELLLSGTIIGYERSALRSLREETGVPREYRITITAEVQARDRRTGQVLLQPTRVTGHCDAFIGDDQQSAELQALPLAAEDLARRVVSLLVERW